MNAELRGEDQAATSDGEPTEPRLAPAEANDSEDPPSRLFGKSAQVLASAPALPRGAVAPTPSRSPSGVLVRACHTREPPARQGPRRGSPSRRPGGTPSKLFPTSNFLAARLPGRALLIPGLGIVWQRKMVILTRKSVPL